MNRQLAGVFKDIWYNTGFENKKLRYTLEKVVGGYVLNINVEYPLYSKVAEIVDSLKLEKSGGNTKSPLLYYQIETGIQALIECDLNGDGKILKKLKSNQYTELGEGMSKYFDKFGKIIRGNSRLMQEPLYDVFDKAKS